MNHISLNIKYLVDKEKIGKDAFGRRYGLSRGVVGTYINDISKPKLNTLQLIADDYGLTLDELMNSDISQSINNTKNIKMDADLIYMSQLMS